MCWVYTLFKKLFGYMSDTVLIGGYSSMLPFNSIGIIFTKEKTSSEGFNDLSKVI